MTLQDQVKQARKEARDLLRKIHINNNKSNVSDLKNEKASLEKELECFEKKVISANKNLAAAKYELEKLDPEHPLHEDQKEGAEKIVQAWEKDLERAQAAKEEFERKKNKADQDKDKQIAFYQDQITKWETGENKVSLRKLEEKAHEILEARGIHGTAIDEIATDHS